MRSLQVQSIDLNHAFTQLAPLAERIRLVSLNASIAAASLGQEGAPFGVVARTLGGLSQELAELLAFEEEFTDIVRSVGHLVRGELEVQAYRRGLDLLYRDRPERVRPPLLSDEHRDAVAALLQPEAEAECGRELAHAADDGAVRRLWEVVLDGRSELVRGLVDLREGTRRLARRLERIRSVAVTEARFVGTNAGIESARMTGDTRSLAALARQIREAAEEVASLATEACDQMERVRQLAEGATRGLGREARAAEIGG